MRVFLACELPGEARTDLYDHIADKLKAFRVLPGDQYHLTLLFFGELKGAQVASVKRGLQALRKAASFPIVFDTVGAFPSAHSPRVVWVGVGEGAEAVQALYRTCARLVERVNDVACDPKPFAPHVTVARAPKGRRPVLPPELGEALPLGPYTISRATLYRSTLTPAGPTYDPLETYPLGGENGER